MWWDLCGLEVQIEQRQTSCSFSAESQSDVISFPAAIRQSNGPEYFIHCWNRRRSSESEMGRSVEGRNRALFTCRKGSKWAISNSSVRPARRGIACPSRDLSKMLWLGINAECCKHYIELRRNYYWQENGRLDGLRKCVETPACGSERPEMNCVLKLCDIAVHNIRANATKSGAGNTFSAEVPCSIHKGEHIWRDYWGDDQNVQKPKGLSW